ncbi:MAG: tetratricopeptide repeat protein [bacterium]|nr:tetratricopeptide repeat protein [bacterium]
MAKGKLGDIFKGLFSKKKGPSGDLKEMIAQSAQDPGDLRLKLQIGKQYFKQKDVKNGIAWYQEVAEKYEEEDFVLKAIAIYKEILKFSPGSVEFNEKLGDLFLKVGIAADAAQQYTIVIHYYLSHHQPENALRVCQKLVEAEPEEVHHRLRLAEIYFNQGMEEESLAEYEKIARKLRKDLKQLDVLAEVYEKILLKRPKEMTLLRELCVFYLKLKNPQKAIRKIERYKLEKDEQFKPIYEKALQLKDMMGKAGEEKA